MTVRRNAWFDLATEITEKLKAAEAEVALLSTLLEAAREDMNTHTAEPSELQKQVAAKSAELLQLSAKHNKLTDELSRVESQNAAGAAVLDDLKSVAKNCERPIKRAKVTR